MNLELWMVFESVSPEEEAVKESLQDHIEKMETDEGVEVIESQYDDISEMKDPHPGLEKGYSQVCEIKTKIDDFPTLIRTIINYGPTYVQVTEPDSFEMELKEAQSSVQQVVDMMHQYAQSGAGGMLISRASDK